MVIQTGEAASDADSQDVVEKEKWLLISPSICMNVIGFALCQVAFFNLIFYYGYQHIYFESTYISIPLFMFFTTMLVVYLITWRASDYFQKSRRAWTIIPFVAVLVGIVLSFFFPSEIALNILCPCLFGTGIVTCTVLFYERCCVFFHGKMAIVVMFTIGVGLIIVFITAQIGKGLFAQTHIFSLLASYVFYILVSTFFTPSSSFPNIGSKENDSRISFSWKSVALTFAATFSQAFMLVWVVENVQGDIKVALGGSAVFTIIFMLGVATYYKKTGRICESLVRKIHLPLVATFAYLFTVFPTKISFGLAIIGYAFTMVPVACSLSALARHIAAAKLSSTRTLGLSSTIASLGYVIGLLLGALSFFPGESDVSQKVVVAAVALCMIIIWMVAAGIGDSYPSSDKVEVVPSISSDGEVKLKEMQTTAAIEEEQQEASSKRRYYKEKLVKLSEDIGLTSRQKDVLELLAKGRNTAYISETLFISVHTVKAHTYEIYKKANVHSQQELISLIDNIKLD